MRLSFPVMHFAICLYRSKISAFLPTIHSSSRDPHIAAPTQGGETACITATILSDSNWQGQKGEAGSPVSLAVAALPAKQQRENPNLNRS